MAYRIIARAGAATGLALAVSGCWWLKGGDAVSNQVPREVPVAIAPLPGGLDDAPIFNSNSPEVVTEAGILLSTLPPGSAQRNFAFQNYAFNGDFTVFSHHIAKDVKAGDRLLCLGLLATNMTRKPITLQLISGASYLSQPQAIFKPLAPVLPDEQGIIFAGPGDRVATDLLHGRSTVPPSRFTVPAHGTTLVYSLPIPTDVAIPPPVNGRSTILQMTCDGPLYLSEIAAFATKDDRGEWYPPRASRYQLGIADGLLAGPRDLAATLADPKLPPPKGFKYGRVAGVSIGRVWDGELKAPAPGQRVGVPISAVFLNRMGTAQIQSAEMRTRYPDTAFQAHGNYGVLYRLQLPLRNTSRLAQRYALTLSHPARVLGSNAVVYLDPPNRPVMFRGPIKVTSRMDKGPARTTYSHVVVRHGEDMPPFATLDVPAMGNMDATIELVYPADATPPQLLTIAQEN